MTEQSIREKYGLSDAQFQTLREEMELDMKKFTIRQLLLRFWSDSPKRAILEHLLDNP